MASDKSALGESAYDRRIATRDDAAVAVPPASSNGTGSNGTHANGNHPPAHLADVNRIPAQTRLEQFGDRELHEPDIARDAADHGSGDATDEFPDEFPDDPHDDRHPTAPTSAGNSVVWDLLKGPEVSFGIEAAQLEREAISQARDWADKGLPRHDLEPGEPLEIEVALARRGAQVFSDWVRHVRARMEGGIQRENEQIGTDLVSYEHQILRYRYVLDTLRITRRDLATAVAEDAAEAEAASKAPKRRVSYQRHMGVIAFWLLMPLLVLADFVANVPVFNELLPTSQLADQALQNFETNATATPLWFGLKTLAARTLVHMDAAILAFTVILLIVFLGHQLGASIRTLVALNGMETAVDDELLRQHQRRPIIPAWASAIGVLAIIGVLMYARANIEPPAQARYAAAQQQLDTVQVQLAAAQVAQNPSDVQRLDLQRQELTGRVEELRVRHEYTEAIAAMNIPIAFLNLVLALSAGIAAYLRQSESLELEPERAPRAAAARARFTSAREDADDNRTMLARTLAQIDTSFARIQHMADARPLREADSKKDRIRGIMQLFRAENARARGLDTRSIKAFAIPAPDPIPDVDLTTGFTLPESLPASLDEFQRLKQEHATLEKQREAAAEVAA